MTESEQERLNQSMLSRLDALEAQRVPEAMLDLPTAALTLALSVDHLKALLGKHAHRLSPARYRFDRRHRKHRMLPASDVRTLQALRIRRSLRLPPAA